MNAAEWWRKVHEELAAKIEAGEPLSRQEARRAAAAIRRDAANPPRPPPQARGRPAKLPADDARMLFDALRAEPEVWTVERALGYIAEVFDVHENTVRDAVRKHKT